MSKCVDRPGATNRRAFATLVGFAAAVLSIGFALTARPAHADAIVPIVDHHQHLLSPAGTELQNRLLPAIALPLRWRA